MSRSVQYILLCFWFVKQTISICTGKKNDFLHRIFVLDFNKTTFGNTLLEGVCIRVAWTFITMK